MRLTNKETSELMNRIVVDDLDLSWDPQARFMHIAFTGSKRVAGGKDARLCIDASLPWVDESDDPWAILVDCKGISGVDAAWRNLYWKFLKERSARVYVGWINGNVLLNAMGFMFGTALSRIGKHFDGRPFNSKEDALNWFSKKGVPVKL